MTPTGGVLTGLGPFRAGVGDPAITPALNLATGLFTVPAGYGGLWLFTSYLYQNDVNTLVAPGGGYNTGGDLRLYTGNLSSGTMIASSAANPTEKAHQLEAGLMSFANLGDGQTVQIGYLPGISGVSMRKFIFTAIRLGRSL